MTQKQYLTFKIGDHVLGVSKTVYEVTYLSNTCFKCKIITPKPGDSLSRIGEHTEMSVDGFQYVKHMPKSTVKHLGKPGVNHDT